MFAIFAAVLSGASQVTAAAAVGGSEEETFFFNAAEVTYAIASRGVTVGYPAVTYAYI